jgi:hypothetical protein
MEDSLHFEIPVQSRVRPVRRARASQRTVERPELLTTEPINLYHWAAVALARAASVTSVVFAALGSVLVLGAMLRAMRLRRSEDPAPLNTWTS